MLPPGIKKEWDENPPWQQALLLAYEEIRQYEEYDMAALGFIKQVT